jgi:glycosyltransferase involved in cell wall biosynthesis
VTIAALIITKNEETTIAACIESCRFADRVIVLDSHSDDATRDIAESLGAVVHMRPFDDYASQRNAAIQLARDYDWVLMIDADERCSPELATEISRTIQNAPAKIGMYRLRRKDMFFSTWLRRASGYPTWFARLARPRQAQVVRAINEECVVDGGEGRLVNHLIHEPFAKGIVHWVDRHNRYSTLEARQLLHERAQGLTGLASLNSNYASARRLLKQLFYRMPCRPTVAFLYLYLFRGGFLDGVAGYRYCRLRAMYEYMIVLKMAELQHSARLQSAVKP